MLQYYKMDGKVAILGCAKDCAKYLRLSLQNAKRIGSMFSDYKIFLMESDSIDGTTDILMSERKDPRVSVFIKNHLSWSLPRRTWRIAYCRNYLLQELIKSGYQPDYVIVMDMDDIGNSDKGPSMIKMCMTKRNHWDAIFPRLTYDTFAFRFPGHTANSGELNQIVPNGAAKMRYFRELSAPGGDDSMFDKNGLMGVFSAFNGIAIYKYKLYIRGTYSGKNMFFSTTTNPRNKGHEECEHVNFHLSLGPCRLMMSKDFKYP
jgi:hypothetical protein